MSAQEEATLARAWREQGDTSARERLVTANLGLVVAIAQRYRNAGVPLEELIAEGNVGLISAVDGFDPHCGSRLSTYAAYWIRQGISRAFAASSPRGRMNSRDRRDVTALERATRVRYARSGMAPTAAEIAEELGWSRKRVDVCKAMAATFTRPASLDQPRPPREMPLGKPGRSHGSDDGPGDAAAAVERLLSDLSPHERAAVEVRFGLHGSEPLGLDAIATVLGKSRREVRVLLRGALGKLARCGVPLTFRAPQEAHQGMLISAA